MNWNVTKDDAKLITKIAKRAMECFPTGDFMTFDMDVTACHLNGCPLDLPKLLAVPKFDFMHDIAGINRHIDRDTGEIGNCFLPRCAMGETTAQVFELTK